MNNAARYLIPRTCPNGHSWNEDSDKVQRMMPASRRNYAAGRAAPCPVCGAYGRDRDRASKVLRVTPGVERCDAACEYARGDTCACTCRGANHGIARPLTR